MGFFDKIVSVAIPTAIGAVTGGPAGAFAGFTTGSQAEKAKRQQKQYREQVAKQEANNMAEIFGSNSSLSSVQAPMAGRSTSGSGFGSGFGSFVSDTVSNIVNPLAGLFTSVSPFFGGSTQQQPAVTTTRGSGAQETQSSGTISGMNQQAGFGNLLAPINKILKNPLGAFGTGIVGGLLGDTFSTPSTTRRITRKMKSQARMVLNMVGGDLNAAANILNISQDELVFVLLKRFRNDGPVVTKAALRKTKQTVRRLKNMCDMYDSLRPTATRRRTPMKRASTTLISNK